MHSSSGKNLLHALSYSKVVFFDVNTEEEEGVG
jgi:hypothetical protein